jgi:hypothetical protein
LVAALGAFPTGVVRARVTVVFTALRACVAYAIYCLVALRTQLIQILSLHKLGLKPCFPGFSVLNCVVAEESKRAQSELKLTACLNRILP